MSPRKYIRLQGVAVNHNGAIVNTLMPHLHSLLLFADKIVSMEDTGIVGSTMIVDINGQAWLVKHTVDEILAKIFMKPELEANNG